MNKHVEDEHIKAVIFDYLADYMLDIDGIPAQEFVERVNTLEPDFTIEDLIDYTYDEGETLASALEHFEESLGL